MTGYMAASAMLFAFPIAAFAFEGKHTELQVPVDTTASSSPYSATARLVDWAKALPAVVTKIHPSEVTEMFGGQVATLKIEVALPLRDVAATLAQARPWVEHLNVLPGEIVLSGQEHGVSWIAALTPGQSAASVTATAATSATTETSARAAATATATATARATATATAAPTAANREASHTSGVLSVWLAASPSAPVRVPLIASLDMPPAARLIFDTRHFDSGRAASLQLWRVPSMWTNPCDRLGAVLRRTGWRPQARAIAALEQWARADEITTLHCLPDDANTLIFMQRMGEPK